MSEDEKAICFCGKTSFSGLPLLEGTVAKEAGGDRFGCATMGGTGFRGAALNEPSAVAGRASSEFAGGSGFGAVGAAGFAAGGAGFLGAAPNELRAIAGFLGLGLTAADFAESEVGFPGLLPFVPTGSA